METQTQQSGQPNQYESGNLGNFGKEPRRSFNGRLYAGLLVLMAGVLLLAKQAGLLTLPYWLFSWPMILIAIGLYVGIKHSFRGPGWIILVLLGGFFLLDKLSPELDFHNYTLPIIVIVIGLFMLLKPKNNRTRNWQGVTTNSVNEDGLDSMVIFGGVKKNIISKDFKGGEVTTIFGGTEINLMQADITGTVVLELTQIFGGTKLILPPHWRVNSDEMVAILGGIDDKRPIIKDAVVNNDRVLVLKGTCVFGGIDIRSY